MNTEKETWSFDGFGVNGADEYKSRLATLTDEGKRLKCGNLLAAAPNLLTALRAVDQMLHFALKDGFEPDYAREMQAQARQAIAHAEKGAL